MVTKAMKKKHKAQSFRSKSSAPIHGAPLHKFFVYLEGQPAPIGMELAGWSQKHAGKRLEKMLLGSHYVRIVPCRSENWPGVQNIGHGARLAGISGLIVPDEALAPSPYRKTRVLEAA
jgi:hypothetical protein